VAAGDGSFTAFFENDTLHVAQLPQTCFLPAKGLPRASQVTFWLEIRVQTFSSRFTRLEQSYRSCRRSS
jgi:hypothetical protein